MQITDVKFYLTQGDPEHRAIQSLQATMEPVPPGINGLFTHTHGLRGAEALPSLRSDTAVDYRRFSGCLHDLRHGVQRR